MSYDAQKKAEYDRRDYSKRRRAAMDVLGGPVCAKCGAEEDLEFDHIDPSQKAGPINVKKSLRNAGHLAELQKCQILCHSCHVEKTRADGSIEKSWTNKPRINHGTVWTYIKHGCRCDDCRSAKARYAKARKFR